MPNRVKEALPRPPFPIDKGKKQPPDEEERTGKHIGETVDFYQPPLDTGVNDNVPDGSFGLYDPDNPDRRMFDSIEQEIIQLSSPPSQWFQIDRDKTVLDEVTGECQVRYFKVPKIIYLNYVSDPGEYGLSGYGLDMEVEIDMFMNYNQGLREYGEVPLDGDLIRTHDGRLFEVQGANYSEESLFRWQHWKLTLKTTNTEGYVIIDEDGKEQDISESPLLWPERPFQNFNQS